MDPIRFLLVCIANLGIHRTPCIRGRHDQIPLLSVFCVFALAACGQTPPPELPAEPTTARSWPGENWQVSTPEREGLDAQTIAQLDEEFRSGKHGYVDSMLIIRNGRMVFEAYYENDYQTTNADLVSGESGPWNYYDVNWHPFYRGSDLHTVQSTTKEFSCRPWSASPLLVATSQGSAPRWVNSYRTAISTNPQKGRHQPG